MELSIKSSPFPFRALIPNNYLYVILLMKNLKMHTVCQKFGKATWFSVWIMGLYCTIMAVYTNWLRYREFESVVNERDFDYYESTV